MTAALPAVAAMVVRAPPSAVRLCATRCVMCRIMIGARCSVRDVQMGRLATSCAHHLAWLMVLLFVLRL